MRTISGSKASRRFSDLLDAIEAGETVPVTRGNRPVAEMHPARSRTGRDLRAALAGTEPPDEKFAAAIANALTILSDAEPDSGAGRQFLT